MLRILAKLHHYKFLNLPFRRASKVLSPVGSLPVPVVQSLHWREVKNERERKAQKAGEAALDTGKKKTKEHQNQYTSSM